MSRMGSVELQLLARMRDRGRRLADAIEPRDGGGPAPLSFGQRRLWFLDRLEPGSAEYIVPVVFRLSGELDVDVLRGAFTAVQARHEVLRTRYTTDAAGDPCQVVDAPGPVDFSMVDVRGEADPQEAARRLLAGYTTAAFDLVAGPVWRVRLIRVAGREFLLAICLHHIASDGWSMGLLAGELREFYTAGLRGRAVRLPGLPIQYADYAVWQHAGAGRLERQLAYWRGRLEGLETLRLPTDRPRPPVRSPRGDLVTFTVPAVTVTALRGLAQRENATVFMVLLTAYHALLARYTNQIDIAVGTPIAGRNRPETENLLGFFVNTLIIRADHSGDPTTVQLLRHVRDRALDAYANQDLPFERIVEELAPLRDLSQTPLIQTWFQDVTEKPWELPGLKVEGLAESIVAKFDLSMIYEEHEGELLLGLEFSADLFERSSVERMAGHFLVLLDGMCGGPDVPVAALNILTPAERRQIEEWNDTAVEYPRLLLHELFERQAAATPQATALIYQGEQISYRRVDGAADRLADRLRGLGAGRGTVVAVHLPRSPDQITAVLAVLKTGAAYLPLNPDDPADRLAYQLADAGAVLVVTDAAGRDRLPATAVPPVVLDAGAHASTGGVVGEGGAGEGGEGVVGDGVVGEGAGGGGAGGGAGEGGEGVVGGGVVGEGGGGGGAGPADLAYVIYTSGSTGRPKGVEVEHRGITNYLHGMQTAFPLAAGVDVVLNATPLTFDVSVYEIFWPLANNVPVVLLPGDRQLDMHHLVELVQAHRVTTLHLVPSLLASFLEHARPEQTGALRQVFTSGEHLTADVVATYYRDRPGRLINLYGATEVSVDSTYWHTVSGGVVHTGRALPNQSVYVLNGHGQPQPVGVTGEIYLGGHSVTRGYRGNPDLTARKFVATPAAVAGRGGHPRLYRTGDLGHLTGAGDLFLTGRTDHQIKLHGVRIEPAEIDNVLTAHPDVVQSLTTVTGDDADKSLTVYYTTGSTPPGVEALREHLARHLPATHVPARYVALPRFPLTSNGKIDRARLPAPRQADVAAVEQPPTTPLQKLIARTWAAALGHTPGIHDNFFTHGGHSLAALKVVNQLRKMSGLDLTVRSIFAAPTIAEFADSMVKLFEEENRAS